MKLELELTFAKDCYYISFILCFYGKGLVLIFIVISIVVYLHLLN